MKKKIDCNNNRLIYNVTYSQSEKKYFLRLSGRMKKKQKGLNAVLSTGISWFIIFLHKLPQDNADT